MRARDIIEELELESRRLPEVLAPVLSPKGVAVFINNHPYQFRITNYAGNGWFVLSPEGSDRAEIEREAYPYEYMDYLEKLSPLACIACRRMGPMSWLVYPFNASDAAQKFPGMTFPREAYLVAGNVEPFDVIICRVMGDKLLYEQEKFTLGVVDDLRQLLAQEYKTGDVAVKNITPEFRYVYGMLYADIEEQRKSTVQGQIEDAIGYLGAQFVGFQESGENYRVMWTDNGNQHEVLVSQDMRLVSAGICLDNREMEQSLTSAVAVMRIYDQGDYDD